MVRFYSRAARRNLKAGSKKMEENMSTAARVRRQFRLGRNPKPGESLPLHPRVVWERAYTALERFRTMMSLEKLSPKHVDAAIVFIEESNPDQPHFVLLSEGEDRVREELSSPDVIALGMLFRQFDAEKKQQSTFPYLFVGLNERGMAVLKKAAEIQCKYAALTKDVN